jgi:hypothetical protein
LLGRRGRVVNRKSTHSRPPPARTRRVRAARQHTPDMCPPCGMQPQRRRPRRRHAGGEECQSAHWPIRAITPWLIPAPRHRRAGDAACVPIIREVDGAQPLARRRRGGAIRSPDPCNNPHSYRDHFGSATQAMLHERTHTPIAPQASGGVRSHGVSRGTCVSVPITPMRDPALGTRRSVNSVT